MVHYLKTENFGPIKDEVEMNFEVAEHEDDNAYEIRMPDDRRLLKLAYIYGANASGKTTVLKAFEFLRKLLLNPVSDKAHDLDFDPFLFCDSPYNKPSRFVLSFYVEGMRYVYEVRFSKQYILHEKIVFYQSAKPTELFSRSTDTEKRLAKIQFGSKIKVGTRERDLLESNTLHNNTVIGGYAKTNVDIPELEKLNKWFSSFLIGMVTSVNDLTEVTASLIDRNAEVKKWINSFLNKADYQITEVDASEPSNQIGIPLEDAYPADFGSRFYTQGSFSRETTIRSMPAKFYGGPTQRKIDFVHKLNDNSYSLSILKESSGTRRYFGLGGLLYDLIHNNRILCIDELETSLHADLMKYFLQAFLMNAKSSQMLITTHNLCLIESQDFIRKDALWFSEKSQDGSVTLYSAADFDSTVLRKGASLVNAYKSGRLGAKPNLGSPYLIEE